MDRRSFGLCASTLFASATLGCIGEVQPRRSSIKRVTWKGAGKRVVGYFTNWAQYRKRDCKFEVRHIDPNVFTHVIFGFAKIDPHDRERPRFELSPFEHNDLGPGGQYAQLNELKKRYPHLKTLLAVGGWSFNDPPTAWIFTTMVEKEEYRAHFIDHAIRYLRANQFDGLDLDWEYPTDEARGGRPQDRENFTALCREFKEAARAEAKRTGREELLLTMAAGAHKAKTVEVEKLGEILDWVNLMTYDFYGGWSDRTGMNAPFSGDPSGDVYVKKLALEWLAEGLPRDKLVLGMPTYGRSFADVDDPTPNSKTSGVGIKGRCTGERGFLAYYEVNDLIESGKYEAYWDEVSGTPYAYDASSRSWITYDDLRSIQLKTDFVLEEDLGGAMFWAIDLDDFNNDYPIVTSVARRLRR